MYQMGTVGIIRTSVVVPGRTFVSYLIQMTTQVKKLNYYVNLSIQERVDLEFWLRFLLIWNGVNMFYDTYYISNCDMQSFMDASST